MCGENLTEGTEIGRKLGSPPHVRGKLLFKIKIFVNRRITPACAGKTDASDDYISPELDHPRMCGENSFVPSSASSNKGSPRHVRGKPTIKSRLAQAMGITPACAGKTFVQALQISICQDHPRMCGENVMTLYLGFEEMGSPPHVRGKPPFVERKLSGTGITPACAGKTALWPH